MSVTIDSLDIQIRTSAGSAEQNIGKLADALERLNKNSKVTRIINSLDKLNGALTNLRSNSAVMGQLSALSKSLSNLAAIPKLTGLRSAIQELKKLPAVMNDLDSADISKFTLKLRQLSAALTPLATQLDKIGTAFNRLPARVSQVVTATNRMTRATKDHGEALNTQSINLMAAYENLQTYLQMLNFVGDAISAMMADAIEWDGIQFRFGRAFGEDAEEVYAYAQKVSDVLKINIQQFMQYSSLYGSLLSGFGMAQEKVTTISVGLTELSYDIWAAYNDRFKTLEDASEAVRSAITGEIEPIRNAGIALTEASLQEYIDSTHLAGVSIEKLTEAQKSEVRYAAMVNAAMQQNIVGTYAREMETAEGAVRTLTQQLKTLGQAIGSLFLPILKAVVPWLSAFVELITEGIVALMGMFGIEWRKISWDTAGAGSGISSLAESADDASGSLGKAAKKAKQLKNYTMGFDELNVIDPTSGSSGGSGGAGGAGAAGWGDGLDLKTLWDDSVFASASKQVDELKQKIKDYVEEHKILLSVVGGTVGFLTFMKVLRGLNSLLGITKTIGMVKTAFTGIATAATKLKSAAGNVKAFFSLLKSGAGLGNTLAATFPNAANVLSTATNWVTGTLIPGVKNALTKLPTLLVNAVKAIPGWGWIVGAIVSLITLAVVDYDFTDLGYKMGNMLGSALKKAGEWLGTAGKWIGALGKGVWRGIKGALDWAKEKFESIDWDAPIIPQMIEVGKAVLDGLIDGIKDGWKNFWGNVKEFIDGFVQGFKDALEIASPSKLFYRIGKFIIDGLVNGVKEKWNSLVRWFNTSVAPKLTLSYWTTKFDSVRSALATKLDAAWKVVKDFFSVEKWKKKVTDAMDAVKKNFKIPSLPKIKLSVSWDTNVGALKTAVYKALGLSGWPNLKWSTYAQGGFPDVGEMFIAREAGPELVGRMGNRTTVANNDQIIEGVAAGVYQAVLAAMNNANTGQTQAVNVYLDGKQIYNSVQKTKIERGVSLMGSQLGYAY